MGAHLQDTYTLMTFAIQTTDGQHLGFLLFAGGPESGDCIFRSLPNESGNFDIAESEHLFDLQQRGEFRWSRRGDESIAIEDSDGALVAELSESRLTSSAFVFNVLRLGSGES